MDIIKTTTLKDLIHRNVMDCPDISFDVNEEISYEKFETDGVSEDNTAEIIISLGGRRMKSGWKQKETGKLGEGIKDEKYEQAAQPKFEL